MYKNVQPFFCCYHQVSFKFGSLSCYILLMWQVVQSTKHAWFDGLTFACVSRYTVIHHCIMILLFYCNFRLIYFLILGANEICDLCTIAGRRFVGWYHCIV
uniref:Uncharacterized protein n=1 Tax=Sipha flava TaxID=143950 RepID=A0A2S2QR47_9HEMI